MARPLLSQRCYNSRRLLLALGSTCVACFAPGIGGEASSESTTTHTATSGSDDLSSTSLSTNTNVTAGDSTGSTGAATTTTTTNTDTSGDSGDSTTASIPSCNDGPTPTNELAFGAPVPLPGVNTNVSEENAWLSHDELTIWITSIHPEGVGGYDVFRATRKDVSEPFGPVAVLPGVNTTANDERPALTADLLTLYCGSNNVLSTGSFDIMAATRDSTLVDFGALAPVANINTIGSESAPYVTADGTELYFASDRSGVGDIYHTELGIDGSFEPPMPVGELNLPDFSEGDPVLSADGLTIFFTSYRDGSSDIFVATRSTRDDGFGAPVSLAEVNTDDLEWPVWLSDDNCRLVFSSNRPGAGNYDLWIAEREI